MRAHPEAPGFTRVQPPWAPGLTRAGHAASQLTLDTTLELARRRRGPCPVGTCKNPDLGSGLALDLDLPPAPRCFKGTRDPADLGVKGPWSHCWLSRPRCQMSRDSSPPGSCVCGPPPARGESRPEGSVRGTESGSLSGRTAGRPSQASASRGTLQPAGPGRPPSPGRGQSAAAPGRLGVGVPV